MVVVIVEDTVEDSEVDHVYVTHINVENVIVVIPVIFHTILLNKVKVVIVEDSEEDSEEEVISEEDSEVDLEAVMIVVVSEEVLEAVIEEVSEVVNHVYVMPINVENVIVVIPVIFHMILLKKVVKAVVVTEEVSVEVSEVVIDQEVYVMHINVENVIVVIAAIFHMMLKKKEKVVMIKETVEADIAEEDLLEVEEDLIDLRPKINLNRYLKMYYKIKKKTKRMFKKIKSNKLDQLLRSEILSKEIKKKIMYQK